MVFGQLFATILDFCLASHIDNQRREHQPVEARSKSRRKVGRTVNSWLKGLCVTLAYVTAAGCTATESGTGSSAIPDYGGATSSGGMANLGGLQTATGGSNSSLGGSLGAAGGIDAAAGTGARGGFDATGGLAPTGGTVASDTTLSSRGDLAEGGNSNTGGNDSSGGVGGESSQRASVLQHHNHASRDGLYIDAAMTKAAAASMQLDASFANAMLSGPTYTQPLYLAGTGNNPDLVIAATEQNRIFAFDAASGAQVYDTLLAAPVPRTTFNSLLSPISSLDYQCGNIDPLGITGTPIIDPATRILYVDAMTGLGTTGTTTRHLVYAVNADTGQPIDAPGWPVDLDAKVSAGNATFNSFVQNQRGALAMVGDKLYVPFGGHWGDCGDYHGWIVEISTSDPTQVNAWTTRANAGGVWAPGGIASDGSSIYFVTGNTEETPNSFSSPDSWQDGETLFRLRPGLVFSGDARDYYVPTNWALLDTNDSDLGGSGPVLFDVPGATPDQLVIALGKDGQAYIMDRNNLGGIGSPLAGAVVANGTIINAAAAYTTPSGTYVVFKGVGNGCPSGQSGGLTAIKIGQSSPPSVSVAWCGGPLTQHSPAVSVSDAQGDDAVVWIVGTDYKLHGVHGETGANVFSGGTATNTMSSVQKFTTPIVANGRVFVAADNQIYAFAP